MTLALSRTVSLPADILALIYKAIREWYVQARTSALRGSRLFFETFDDGPRTPYWSAYRRVGNLEPNDPPTEVGNVTTIVGRVINPLYGPGF